MPTSDDLFSHGRFYLLIGGLGLFVLWTFAVLEGKSVKSWIPDRLKVAPVPYFSARNVFSGIPMCSDSKVTVHPTHSPPNRKLQLPSWAVSFYSRDIIYLHCSSRHEQPMVCESLGRDTPIKNLLRSSTWPASWDISLHRDGMAPERKRSPQQARWQKPFFKAWGLRAREEFSSFYWRQQDLQEHNVKLLNSIKENDPGFHPQHRRTSEWCNWKKIKERDARSINVFVCLGQMLGV